MHVEEGTAASCRHFVGPFFRVAWHQMGSISKKQLRRLMRPGAKMLKRPCPPYAGLLQEGVEAHRSWEGC